MDLWVVAAATGAGYVAKYWRNLTSRETETETETSSESFSFHSSHQQSDSRNLLQQIRDQTNPLRRLATKQDFLQEDLLGVAGTRNSPGQVESDEGFNLLCLTRFPQKLTDSENFRVAGKGMDGMSNFSEVSGKLKSSNSDSCSVPLDSIERSLTAQLYTEYVEVGEYVFKSVPSQPTPTMRPFVLTDGCRIISRAGSDFREDNEMQLLSKKLRNYVPRQSRRFSMMRESLEPYHSQGFRDSMFRFFLGIAVGVLSAIITNISKVDNLKEMLLKTENLVDDLQEELDMKASLNVKEVANEDMEALGTNEHQLFGGTSYASDTTRKLDVNNVHCGEESDDQSAKKTEAMSKIEAELVAELERLELNMKNSSLETVPESIEDPDFVTDVHCNLNLDQAMAADSSSYPDLDVRETFSNHPDETNYPVSPRELSVRLHRVIQSRLEERIMELETALENSQRRLHSLELDSIVSWGDLYGEVESTSQESQTFIDDDYKDDSWF